jgi:hypothetical protein
MSEQQSSAESAVNKWVTAAVASLNGYERDCGESLPDDHEIGRIEESRDTPSFRLRVGHIRQLETLLAALSDPSRAEPQAASSPAEIAQHETLTSRLRGRARYLRNIVRRAPQRPLIPQRSKPAPSS